MAKPICQLLAQSLKRSQKSAERGVVRAKKLARVDLERLKTGGWLTLVVRGWYLLKQPNTNKGDSTQWYSSFWDFISVYLTSRFENNYCLSASTSIDLHLGSTKIPKQLLVMVKKGGSSIINLPFNTSIFIYQETKTFPQVIEQVNDINVIPLHTALHRVPAKFFISQASDAEIALKLVDITALSRELLSGTNMASASRLIGAYLFLNETKYAERLQSDLTAAGYSYQAINPFTRKQPLLSHHSRIQSPYAARITILWQEMRETVLAVFPAEPGQPRLSKKYFTELEKLYLHDAYNSLSIEGYEVSKDLIEKIARGEWNPEHSLDDRNQINAMAAKGYRQTFDSVKLSIERILGRENPGKTIKEDIHRWHLALFSPSVKAGILKPEQLAGYRNQPVFIRGSMHTPLPKEALMDAMEAFFNCLINEPSAAVRAVLGHFIFVFIHPYMDGNGRLGRFIMNVLLASGGFPWTIVKVANRDNYMKTLEKASIEYNIKPFAKFILNEMRHPPLKL